MMHTKKFKNDNIVRCCRDSSPAFEHSWDMGWTYFQGDKVNIKTILNLGVTWGVMRLGIEVFALEHKVRIEIDKQPTLSGHGEVMYIIHLRTHQTKNLLTDVY